MLMSIQFVRDGVRATSVAAALRNVLRTSLEAWNATDYATSTYDIPVQTSISRAPYSVSGIIRA